MNNTGPAILAVGSLWLHLAYGLHELITILLLICSFFAWLTIDTKTTRLIREKLELEIAALRRRVPRG